MWLFFFSCNYSFDRHALELLEKMLVLDPSQRISAKDALDADYFWTDPLPCDPKRYRIALSFVIVYDNSFGVYDQTQCSMSFKQSTQI